MKCRYAYIIEVGGKKVDRALSLYSVFFISVSYTGTYVSVNVKIYKLTLLSLFTPMYN